jgi:hypothetical protein
MYRWAFATGRENDLISMEVQNQIPKQTRSNWRNLAASQLRLLEQDLQLTADLDELLAKEAKEWFHKRRLFRQLVRLQFSFVTNFGELNYLKLLAINKLATVNLIEEFSLVFPKSQLLKWFHLKSAQYNLWFIQVKFDCNSSHQSLCSKRHPYQLTLKEYTVIENAINNCEYLNWSKSAIHSQLFNKGLLTISRSTFYKHCNLIAPKIERKYGKKPAYKPLRATYVNEYWHMDISYFKTQDGKQSYIYAIIDNYSRKIIAWDCRTTISKKVIGELICRALQSVSINKLNLVSDGGSENVNHFIENLLIQFTDQQNLQVTHLVALKNIVQSNSMIERFFRTMKSFYLYINIPKNHEDLCLELQKIIHQYNYVRAHHSLKHLTPHEVFCGIQFPNIHEQLLLAQKLRIKNNKNCSCLVCTCI